MKPAIIVAGVALASIVILDLLSPVSTTAANLSGDVNTGISTLTDTGVAAGQIVITAVTAAVIVALIPVGA